MNGKSPEEIAKAMIALDVWGAIENSCWAVKAAGCAAPYFCAVLPGDGKPVKTRFLMIEGWQSFNDFVRTRIDPNFGFISSPMEIPHFEIAVGDGGAFAIARYDPGYAPRRPDERESGICARIMWEAYGMMMRIEADKSLPLKFADEKAMFSRYETAPGEWEDRPLAIPDPVPHVEKVSFAKDLIAKAKDLPFEQNFTVELDLRILPGVITREKRPRLAYLLAAVDAANGARVVWERTSIVPDAGIRGIWEGMPPKVLQDFVNLGRIPGEIKTSSGRVFRLLRPLCLELPLKLSLHDRLETLEKEMHSPQSGLLV